MAVSHGHLEGVGVKHDPERGITLLNQAAEKKVASAYVMLGSA